MATVAVAASSNHGCVPWPPALLHRRISHADTQRQVLRVSGRRLEEGTPVTPAVAVDPLS